MKQIQNWKQRNKKQQNIYNRETELNDQLVQTQQLRKKRFDKLFDRIEKEIKTLHQKLTENQNRVGGTVLLHIKNKEEPFEGGLKYTPNTLNKNIYIYTTFWRREGYCFNCTLLLTLNAAIDAHLDQDNAEKLQKIVKLLSNKILFVLISHNPDVIAHSDSLVGVTIYHSKTIREAFPLLL